MLITIDHRLNAKALNLNANEASVLAAITKCTLMGKGWYADYEALADALEFVVSAKTVNRAVKKLINLGAVEKRQNVLYAKTNCPASETNCPQSGTNCPSPAPPIIINNETMKSNEIIARDTIATPNPKDQYSFDRLEKLFMKRTGTFQMAESVRNDSRSLWEQYPLWKRILLLEELTNPTGQVRPRLDWTLTAFNPQPKFLSGYDQDDYWKSAEWTKNHKPLVMVEYQGAYKVCTEQTMHTFDLKFKRNVLPYND